METKNEKFKRLAEKRTNRLLKDLELIGNLSNKANYDYTEKDIRKMFQVIDEHVQITKNRFRSSNNSKKFKF